MRGSERRIGVRVRDGLAGQRLYEDLHGFLSTTWSR
jgi:hypothetical protein